MNEQNQHIQLLEKAVDLLGDLKFDVVFIGGATISLFLDDPAAGDIRPTDDVDCVVSATTYVEFTNIEDELRQHGFTQLDVDGGPVIRWRKRNLLFDIVPSNPSTIGFSESEWMDQEEPTLETDDALEEVREELEAREPISHHPEFGADRKGLEAMTGPEFWEVGASGRRYSRACGARARCSCNMEGQDGLPTLRAVGVTPTVPFVPDSR